LTHLLEEAENGRPGAADQLLELVYSQLRAIAQRQMNKERPAHTLQATALVHEAYVRLIGDREVQWNGRSHFFLAAAEAMRRILIEHARKRGRLKRGGDRRRVFGDVLDLAAGDSREILALDEALRRLGEQDEQAAAVVRLRFFAGLSVKDTAAALSLSERTVNRQWLFARACLFKAMEREARG
jgi:RNA polymerase sigma factor (TIGR02999 family)